MTPTLTNGQGTGTVRSYTCHADRCLRPTLATFTPRKPTASIDVADEKWDGIVTFYQQKHDSVHRENLAWETSTSGPDL